MASVQTLLQEFQDGYTRRDPDHLEVFMALFVPGDELEVIGTNALEPGSGEWRQGQQAVRDLILGALGRCGF